MSPEIPTNRNGRGRNPLVLLGGSVLIGLALVLVIFGGRLFSDSEGQTADNAAPVLEQVPSFDEIQSELPSLPTNSGEPLAVGDLSHDFVLNDLDGNAHQLSKLRGQPVVVNFWATWCAPCRIEMPELQAAFEKYQDDGLVILALDQAEPADVVHDFFFGEMGLTFTPLLDSEGAIAEQYGVFNFPSTFFINADGLVTAVHRGPMVQSQIEGYLADTLSNQG